MLLSEERPWLVTGAAGFLGSHLVEQLLERSIKVVGLDDLSWGRQQNIAAGLKHDNFQFVQADIRDGEAVSQTLAQFRPSVIVHLAALHYIPAAVANPPLALSINVLGTQTILSAAMKYDVERLWFASTGDVYAPSETPHNENDTLEPFNIYGLSKLQGEQLMCLMAQSQPTKHFIIGRLFNLYGTRETNPHIIPEILQQLKLHPDEPLRLGNLWPRRELIPVTDAALAIIEMVLASHPGVAIYNVATGMAQTIQDVIEMIGELCSKPLLVETDPKKVRLVERPHLQANVTKLYELLGWTPNPDLRRGLTELLRSEGLLKLVQRAS